MFGAPLRAPGTGPKPTDGFLGFLGEAKTTIVSGTCMFLFIMGAWLFGLVQIPLPGLVVGGPRLPPCAARKAKPAGSAG